MAAPQTGVLGSIRLNIVDGTRLPVAGDLNLLIRVLDGRKQTVATKWVVGGTIPIIGLPFHDNPDDWYPIIIHADGYQDAGLSPVRLQRGRLIDAYAMLLPDDGMFHFPPLAALNADPRLFQLIANGSV